MQNSNTSDLIFGIDHIVSYVSHFMTLMPGDVIPTGTPSGVGLGMKPPQFLQARRPDAAVGRGLGRAGPTAAWRSRLNGADSLGRSAGVRHGLRRSLTIRGTSAPGAASARDVI